MSCSDFFFVDELSNLGGQMRLLFVEEEIEEDTHDFPDSVSYQDDWSYEDPAEYIYLIYESGIENLQIEHTNRVIQREETVSLLPYQGDFRNRW